MLNLNDIPYLGLHGNRTGVYNFNASSYLSAKHEKPTSSMMKKCTLNPGKTREFLKSHGFNCIASYSYSMMDDTTNEKDFVSFISNDERKDYIVDCSTVETYSNSDCTVLVQISMKEYSLKTDDGHRLIVDIDNTEMAFLETERTYCEGLSKDLMMSCYQRASQFIDEDSPIIGIIGSTPEGMYVKEYNLGKGAKNLSDEELDLHYGESFSEFHTKLTGLLKSDSKGLIIFHGQPGTGKTYYIRMLLKDLVKSKKNVLYVPSNFIDSFLDPSFITFLSDWILEQNNPTIILLEDAECLVESRDSGVRSLGISNLLNITDGILNDILGTQIILTFNTNLDYIDSALLRPERLLARKEFTNLTREESSKLVDHLGITHTVTDDMSLADIYSLKNNRTVLYHNIKEKKSKVGFVI
jgi:SpoVK/Ycf46/Vps4 family AAA+-type ATPase